MTIAALFCPTVEYSRQQNSMVSEDNRYSSSATHTSIEDKSGDCVLGEPASEAFRQQRGQPPSQLSWHQKRDANR
jgi:hypothetical protein